MWNTDKQNNKIRDGIYNEKKLIEKCKHMKILSQNSTISFSKNILVLS